MAAICIAPQTIPRHQPPPPASTSACDRCHALRVKCVPSNTFKGCCRCFRLQHQCSYSRRRGMPGRKKRRQDADSTSSSPSSPDRGTCIPQRGNWVLSKNMPGHDSVPEGPSEALVSATRHRLCTSIDPVLSIQPVTWRVQLASFYTLATCFAPVLDAKVQANITRSPPFLRDLYLALNRVIGRVEAGQTEHEQSDISTCSLGLQILRDTKVSDLQSLASFLWLGIFLKSFDRLVLGTSTHLICETTLLQLRNWYPTVSADLEMMDPIVCLVFTNTITSLINRRIPIIKLNPPRAGLIDRFAGLCCDLLPLLYEACGVVAAGELEDRLIDVCAWNDVYQRVYRWEPHCPAELHSRFTPNEVTTLLTQAHAYRLATLLILNQTRCPQEPQTQFANEILVQMETCQSMVGEPPPHTILPIFIAALEIPDWERRFRALQILKFCRGANHYPYLDQLGGMCSQFWSQRDAGGSSDWLSCLHRYHPLNIPV